MADQNRTPPYPLTPDAPPRCSSTQASLPDAPDDVRARLLQQIEETPHAFDFYQAVRRLDCAHPDKPQTGHSSRLADDPIRFGQEASMAFAPATLQGLETPRGKPPRLIQRFLGLCGPQGPLPLHLTEYVRDRVRNHDDLTLLRFFDVFHHRMISFFYRAWARVRPTVSFDHPDYDRFSDYVGSLFGLGMRSLRRRDALPDLTKFHFAGLLSCQTKHAEGLLAILAGYFRLPVQIEEFVGQWIELPADCRCMMGLSSSSLGVNTTVGSHVWDCQQKFRIILGPLSLDEYYRMLPGESEKTSPEDELTAENKHWAFAETDETQPHELPHGGGVCRDTGPVPGAIPAALLSDGPEPTTDVTARAEGEPSPFADRPFQYGPSSPSAIAQTTRPNDFAGERADQLSSASDSSFSPMVAGSPVAGPTPSGQPPLDSREAPFSTSIFKTQAAHHIGRAGRTAAGASSSATRVGATPGASKSAEYGRAARGPAGASQPSAGLDRLIAAVRSYIGDELQWDLQLILRKEDTPPLGLGIVGHLGWSSWLLRDPLPRDPDDMVLDAAHTPISGEKLPYRHLRRWGHLTLGHTRDGRYIVATVAPQALDPLPAAPVK